MFDRPRRAARIVIVDEQGRTLLLQHDRGNGQLFWAPPGGGLEPGESFESAAQRELEEELGWKPEDLALLREGTVRFLFRGVVVEQDERFFLARASSELALTVQSRLVDEVLALRWWTREEIESADEEIFPEDLLELLAER